MNVTIKDNNQVRYFFGVEKIIFIDENHTLSQELKNSFIIIHKANTYEKFRFFNKDCKILSIEEEKQNVKM